MAQMSEMQRERQNVQRLGGGSSVQSKKESGFCKMDPMLGTWVRICSGVDSSSDTTKNAMKLRFMAQLLLPELVLTWRQHTADGDAQIHLELYRKIRELCARSEQQNRQDNL